MYCEECGYELKDLSTCPRCGKQIGNHTKKKIQTKNALILAIILSVVSIGVLLVGFKLVSSPKTIMLQSLSKLTTNMENYIKGTNSDLINRLKTSDKLGINSTLSIKLDEELGLGLNEISLKSSFIENKSNKVSNLSLELLVGDDNIFLDTVLENNKIYLKIKEITDKYYYTDFDYISLFEDTESIEYEKLIDILKRNLTDALDSKDITKTKENIFLGEKEKKVTKLTYKVTTKKLNEIVINILEDVKKDSKLLESIANNLSTTKKELTKDINNLVKDLKEEKDEFLFNYNVYYYGFNNIVREEITDESFTFRYTTYDDTKEVTLLNDGIIILDISYTNVKTGYNFKGTIMNYPFTGTYNSNTKVLTSKVNLNDDSYLEFKVKETIKDTNTNYKVNTNITITGKINDYDLKSGITIDIVNDYIFNKSVKNIDLEDATEISKITEEEINTILENIESHPLLSEIFGIYEDYFGIISEYDNLEY